MGANLHASREKKRLHETHLQLFLQYIFLYECFERIQEEHTWRHQLETEKRREREAVADQDAGEESGTTATTSGNEVEDEVAE